MNVLTMSKQIYLYINAIMKSLIYTDATKTISLNFFYYSKSHNQFLDISKNLSIKHSIKDY